MASYGPDHPDVARDLNNLAALLHDTNRLAEAEPLMERALAIDEASYSPDHPDVARDLNNLAGLLQDMNRLDQAEPHARRAFAIMLHSLGLEHPETKIIAKNWLGIVDALGGDMATEMDKLLAELLSPEESGG